MAPAPAPSALLEQALGTGLKLNISGTLPGEQLLIAILTTYATVRAGMDPALVARWDAVTVQQIEDLQHVWRGLWQTLGVLKP